MKRRVTVLLALLAVTLVGCALHNGHATPALSTEIRPHVPRTGKAFVDGPQVFHFAIVGDRTGDHRRGVFAHAMQQLNWLQPAFVTTIGDQIEGYSTDPQTLDSEWAHIREMVDTLDMPYFYVVGNHDISNAEQLRVWRKRLGAPWYHFVYKDVLFIALDTEDPPTAQTKKTRLQAAGVTTQQLRIAIVALRKVKNDPNAAHELMRRNPTIAKIAHILQTADRVTISNRQVADVRRALADNPHVRWTFVFMHKPAWRYDAPNFRRIEKLLADRPYTLFAGHLHYYAYTERHGHDYIQLATTGGTQQEFPPGPRTMDHIVWVTMRANGPPQIANIRLDGLFGRHGPSTRSATHSTTH